MPEELGNEEILKAAFNIMEDFAEEREKARELQAAVFNILEDSEDERRRLAETQRALLNILDDLESEKVKVERSLREREVLLKEIHHRVKNNLQITSSLLRLQAKGIADPRAREAFSEAQNRVSAIAMIHEKLYKSQSLAEVDFAEFVASFAALLLETFDVDLSRIELRVAEERFRVSIDRVVPLGLIINELLSNCIKHAFPDRRPGRISVSWRLEDGVRVLGVADDGVGVPDGFALEKSSTLGLQLVQRLARQLRGTVEIVREGGTRVVVRYPEASESP